jgi:hypothetical protein
LLTGAPSDDADPYLLCQAGDVRVFYPARLQVRPGADRIRIRLRNVLLIQWLELEGARSIVSAPAEESADERQ